MAAGVTDNVWTLQEIAALLERPGFRRVERQPSQLRTARYSDQSVRVGHFVLCCLPSERGRHGLAGRSQRHDRDAADFKLTRYSDRPLIAPPKTDGYVHSVSSGTNYTPESNREWRSEHEQELREEAKKAHLAEAARPTRLHRLIRRLRRIGNKGRRTAP
jgi:hypothetical protein